MIQYDRSTHTDLQGTFGEIQDIKSAVDQLFEEVNSGTEPRPVALYVGTKAELESKKAEAALATRVKALEEEARTTRILNRSPLVRPTANQVRRLGERG